MATIYRAYHRSEDFQKYRIFTVHITALVVLTLLLSHHWLRLLPWIFTIYLTWSPWHYSGQNYGLFMMFARRAGANPDKATRRALYGAFIVSYLILFLGFHTGPSTRSAVSIAWNPTSRQPLGANCAGRRFRRAVSVWTCPTGASNRMAQADSFANAFLLAVSLVSAARGNFADQRIWRFRRTATAPGVLAVMHSAQYLWITSYYARREASGDGAPVTAEASNATGVRWLFRSARCRRHRVVHSWSVAGEPRFSSRFHGQLSHLHRVGEHSSLHSGWRHLEAARWPHRVPSA